MTKKIQKIQKSQKFQANPKKLNLKKSGKLKKN